MSEENSLPPPDRWARLAAEERRKQNRRDGCLVFLLVALIIAIFWGIIHPGKHVRKAATSQMISNARQIGLGLFEFEIAYGKFPDASTIAEVKQSPGTALTLNDATSNDLFKQLLATKCVYSEKVFGAFETRAKRPDDAFDKDSNALLAGECGFAYVLGPSSADEPDRPLVFGPVRPGTKTLDLKINDGRAVVLRANNSCSLQNVKLDDGRISMGNGILFDPVHPVWNGKPLEIKWPK